MAALVVEQEDLIMMGMEGVKMRMMEMWVMLMVIVIVKQECGDVQRLKASRKAVWKASRVEILFDKLPPSRRSWLEDDDKNGLLLTHNLKAPECFSQRKVIMAVSNNRNHPVKAIEITHFTATRCCSLLMPAYYGLMMM